MQEMLDSLKAKLEASGVVQDPAFVVELAAVSTALAQTIQEQNQRSEDDQTPHDVAKVAKANEALVGIVVASYGALRAQELLSRFVG